jgi:hypothetical protein
MLLSGELSEENIRTFAEAVSMKITKCRSAGEQINQPDAE